MQLFFYGVLQGRLASPAIRKLLSGLGPGRRAIARGRLYAIRDPRGCYPALVAGKGQVRGMLYKAGSVDLVGLDGFEGEEYSRAEIEVIVQGRREPAQAWLWARPATRLEPVPQGDFARWLAETGNRPFAP